MQKALGLLVLGTGLGFALYANAPSPAEREEQVAAITRIVARATILEPTTVAAEQPGLRRPVGSPEPAPNVAGRSPAPGNFSAIGQAPPQDAGPAPAATDLATPASGPSPPPPEPPAAIPAAIPEWQTAVAPVTVVSPPAAAAPADSPKLQRALARQIQAELKRVGCYTGRLDGSWGDQSRSAMIAFIGRVNASLPTTEPDVILLSLVKNHTGQVCGMSCRPTEVASGGRCVPRTVLAATEIEPPAPRVAVRPAPIREPLPGRMSMGGPTPAPAAAAPVTEWPSPAGERLPWQSEPAPAREAPADVAAVPSAYEAEPEFSDAERPPGAYRPAAPRRAAKSPRPRAAKPPPQKRRYHATRSVQMLFLHPLGRM